MFKAYANSKLALMMFAEELQQRLVKEKSKVIINSVNPGERISKMSKPAGRQHRGESGGVGTFIQMCSNFPGGIVSQMLVSGGGRVILLYSVSQGSPISLSPVDCPSTERSCERRRETDRAEEYRNIGEEANVHPGRPRLARCSYNERHALDALLIVSCNGAVRVWWPPNLIIPRLSSPSRVCACVLACGLS